MNTKFRVWDSKNNKYFEPTYKAYEGNVAELLINMDGQLLLRTFNQISHESTFPDRFIVEHYTGLNDKNGKVIKEIYEGDIIAYAESLDHECYLESLDAPNEHYDEIHDEERGVAPIIYGIADDYPAFDLDEHDFESNGLSALVNESYWYEVIGNIHENPELLRVK